jgi:cell filamentation protein
MSKLKHSPSKYDVKDHNIDEAHNVLKNKLNIIDEEKLELKEAESLFEAYKILSKQYLDNYRFNESDVKFIHKTFLGPIYAWAGEYRTVDLVSPDIRWCHAQYIQSEMEKFGKLLEQNTPFKPNYSREELLRKLAIIHGELIIIHPFRDGNGRTTRLLCDLLLMQAGYPPIVKNFLNQSKSYVKKYHLAIQEVWTQKKYSKLINVLNDLIGD